MFSIPFDFFVQHNFIVKSKNATRPYTCNSVVIQSLSFTISRAPSSDKQNPNSIQKQNVIPMTTLFGTRATANQIDFAFCTFSCAILDFSTTIQYTSPRTRRGGSLKLSRIHGIVRIRRLSFAAFAYFYTSTEFDMYLSGRERRMCSHRHRTSFSLTTFQRLNWTMHFCVLRLKQKFSLVAVAINFSAIGKQRRKSVHGVKMAARVSIVNDTGAYKKMTMSMHSKHVIITKWHSILNHVTLICSNSHWIPRTQYEFLHYSAW